MFILNCEITNEKIKALVKEVYSSISEHEVRPELRDSLLSDVMFSFMAYTDAAFGGDRHETIFALLDDMSLEDATNTVDSLICGFAVWLGKGAKVEGNILLSDLESQSDFIESIEILLELRDVTELESLCDIKKRMLIFNEKKGKMKKIDLLDIDDKVISQFDYSVNRFGEFEQSSEDLCRLLSKACREIQDLK